MFKLDWRNNRYVVFLLPNKKDILWHSTLAEYKKRNNRFHVVIKAEPVEITEHYHESVKLEKPIQKHFAKEIEARNFIYSYFKTFNEKVIECQ